MKMKIPFITSLLFATIVNFTQLSAQEGMVRYRYILTVDSAADLRNTEGVPAFLYFTPARSLYVYDRLKDTAFVSQLVREKQLENESFLRFEERDDEGNMFYKNFTTGKLSMRRLVLKEAFLSEEPLPVIHWNTSADTRKIGGFNCRKATTHFRGRDYEAWYAPAIAVSDGPWKLRGLPGLILEAYDKSGEIQFLFEAVKVPYPATKDIKEPKKGTPIPFEKFKHIEQTQADKLVKLLMSSPERREDVDIKVKVYPIEKDY